MTIDKNARSIKKRSRTNGLPLHLCTFAYVAITLCVTTISAVAEPGNTQYRDNSLEKFSTFLACENYAEAKNVIGSLNIEDAENLAWNNLLNATLILSQQIDFGDTLGLDYYYACHDKSSDLFFKLLDKSSVDSTLETARYLSAIGTLHGVKAQLFAEVLHKTMKSVGAAKKGAGFSRKALEHDPSNSDAKLSLALYSFWKSNVLKSLSWTPFVGDNRNESIITLLDIANSDHRNRHSAAKALVWIYVELEEYQKAISIANRELETLGEVRDLLESSGKAYYFDKQWSNARKRYDRLVKSIRNQERRNLVREVGALHRLAHIALEMDDFEAVRTYANEALSLPLNPDEQDRKKNDIKRLNKLLKEIKGK
jgi:tetratricopeptide (TPR) repeat protein